MPSAGQAYGLWLIKDLPRHDFFSPLLHRPEKERVLPGSAVGVERPEQDG